MTQQELEQFSAVKRGKRKQVQPTDEKMDDTVKGDISVREKNSQECDCSIYQAAGNQQQELSKGWNSCHIFFQPDTVEFKRKHFRTIAHQCHSEQVAALMNQTGGEA